MDIPCECGMITSECSGIGATAPGYITLGKAWAYGDVSNVGTPEDTSDGGAVWWCRLYFSSRFFGFFI